MQQNYRNNVRENMEAACKEFIGRINSDALDMFEKSKTKNKLKRELCYCDPKIVDIEYLKSVKRAKIILQLGLKKLNLLL